MQAVFMRMLEQYQAGTLTQPQGQRSPLPGALKDLRDPGDPSKRLHRPMFAFTQVDSYTTPTEYPKVKWHQNGTDTLVLSRAAEDAMGAEWSDTPSGKALDPAERVKAEMMALSPEDQELVRSTMREARLKSIQTAMAELSPAEVDALMGSEPAKRGPGRPRKADGDRP
jgi:hypothetical protein